MRLRQLQRYSVRCCLGAILAVPCLAMGADQTWNNSTNNNLWGTATNWVGNMQPASADNAVFTDPPGGGTVDLGAATRTINTLHFSNTTGSYDVTDGMLALSQITQDADVFSNTIDATAAISASTLTMDVEGGVLNVAGKITATNLVLPFSAANAQQVQLSNTSNSISSVSIQGGPALNAFDPGSIGSASVQLSGGGMLGLYTDITNANYNNPVSVSGSGGLVADVADASGPSSNVVNLGALTMQAAANLSFETRDNYAIAVTSTSISGAATFVGTQTFLGEGPSQLQLGTVTGTAGASITLSGIGKLVLNQASSYSGGTYVDGGMLVLGATGAASSGPVDVYSGGAVDMSTALASLPTLNIGMGGVADAALAGNLTGAIYSGGSENVFLASGSIIAATAGPVPVRGVDVASAAYYLGITSDTQNVAVGDNAAHTSIYMGAAFGLYTPSMTAFSGTISAAQTGQNLPIYVAPGAQEFSGEKFNTTDTTTGVDFSGPGEIVFMTAPGGSATVYTDTGDGANSQDNFLVTLAMPNTLASGKTFNVSNGIFYPGTTNAVASGGIVNVNTGATLFLDPGAMTNGPTTGTYKINAGGAVYLSASTAAPGHGATFNFAANSLILIGGSLSTGSPNFLPSTSDIILDTPGTLAITGAGIVLGNGHRLTTSPASSITLSGGSGISAAAGAGSVTITASGPTSTLQINDSVSLANTDLQIGDSNSFTTTNFTQRVLSTQDGTVILNNNANAIKDLTLASGTFVVGQTSGDHFSTGNYTQNGGTATFHGKLTLSGALTINAGVTHLPANFGASGADSAASLSVSSGATLDIGDNTLNLASATASSIRSNILAAYDHGNWDQPGLTSSLAATHRGTGIGYTTSGSSASIRFTWLGDTNLDGVVNSADLSAISSSGTTWQTGDFNYDGVVNADDYALFMLGDAESGSTNISATLPEPSLLIASGAWLLGYALPRRRVKARQILLP
jgi:fibronectin-binding autotransporter adhesin